MADTRVRSTKLTFKGESKSKKRKRKVDDERGHDDVGEGSSSSDPKAWVHPDVPIQVLGPTFILHPSSPPVCISYDSARARITLHPVSNEDNANVMDLIPTEVSQVWVVTRVAGSPTINLRTADGKFLSCDAHGVVSSDREARGPQEEWTPVILPDGMVAFQNMYEKYLSVDEVAGGNMVLRGDTEEVGFAERFHVKVQSEYKRKAGEDERKKKVVESIDTIDEAGTNKKYQAWGAGRSIVSNDDKAVLKRAKKEGKLSEALLDRRAKLKSDRFC